MIRAVLAIMLWLAVTALAIVFAWQTWTSPR